ncbi:F-box/WD repeat-containing 10 [Senna tora]|uniref:F-box/WD repeat-containing 10 n=1 Tax=Senna tora TaxID=362788 RepID=A0A834TB85_9FABA|nr:F-box/WD repeat-containing 10 [Senna tora]
MSTSLDSPSPLHLNQEGSSSSGNVMASSPLFSPASDKRFWSNLRSRVDTLLDDRHTNAQNASTPTHADEKSKRLKEGSLLLIRGFDSVAHTLSLLSNNLDNALQGARELSHPPTLRDIFQSNLNKEESKEEESNKGIKRKYDPTDLSEDNNITDDSQKNKDRNLKKAKNLAISMASKAASLARELKSIKSDLSFMQERCALLEEENSRLRDGFEKGIRPEEDDLVRLQLEALLAEKSRLANENANLIRENQCLHQLVEYHQHTSQDLSASYEEVIHGLCLDFSSPLPSTIAEEPQHEDEDEDKYKAFQTPRSDLFHLSTSPDKTDHDS